MSDIEQRGAAALDKLASEKKPKKRLRLVKTGGETFDPVGRRVIRHDPGKLPEILDQTGLALADNCDNLFSYTGRLVRVYAAPETASGGVHRPRGALVLHQVDGSHLTELATAAAVHERYDARSEGYKPCDCPRRVADAYLARGNWPELRPLAGFIEAPTVTLKGRLIHEPGHDSETGLYQACAAIPGWTPPPAKPTRGASQAALDVLLDLVHEFPFVADEDKAAVVAGIITGLLRRVLPAAPLLAVTAPTPGTGKTLIAETFAIIATGRRASVLSLGHDDAEAEKRLAGVLLAGDAVIALDNIERPLKGDLLCQVATQQFVRLRPLGASGMLSIPTHALMVATGNNLSIVGDLKRRVALIRMDSGEERPEQRTFSRDHLEDVFARRGELIRAALTLPLAYLAAGAPAVEGMHPLGGFEQWDRMVRRPLAWLGLPDPLKASESLREQDPDLEGMRLLLGAWHDAFQDKPKTAAELVAAGMIAGGELDTIKREPLYDALQLVCNEKPNARRLGYWLRRHQARIVDGMQVKQALEGDAHAKVARWIVLNSNCG
jgi:putative DNA primase/helicase